jgi:hypothetical protein
VIQLNGTVLSVAADPYRPIGIVRLEAGKTMSTASVAKEASKNYVQGERGASAHPWAGTGG